MKLHNETLLTGYDADGNIIFCKAYNYETQKDECQSDLDELIKGGYAWVRGKAEFQLKTEAHEKSLELLKRIAENKTVSSDLEDYGFDVKEAIKED